MSRLALCAAVLIALSASACARAEQSSSESTASPDTATSSSATKATGSTTSTTVAPTSGPAADILNALQVSADDYHDMSFGGETPESMTNEPGQVAFITPSANIACAWSPTDPTGTIGLTCSAKERTSPPPARPADCGMNWATGYVQLGTDGKVENGVCTGGVLSPSIANVLEYDSALVAGDFGCLSAEKGVTCAHIPSGRGFVFSRENLTTF
jgi:hypothetical protein